jgi:hypothetical protein
MENKLTELIVVEGMVEAEIIKSELESFEIPCVLKFESAGRLFGITMNGLGKVRVMVHPDHLERAKELLEAQAAPETEDSEE